MSAWLVFFATFYSQIPEYGLPITVEPIPADEVIRSFILRCESDTLEVTGYGGGRPAGRAPALLLNGHKLQGRPVDLLLSDLSVPTAVYRLTGRCAQTVPGILFHVYVGENVMGEVRYRSGQAVIVNGEVRYPGLEEADSNTFWFR